MKNLAFDTSTIISLATNNLLWTLESLKKKFNGTFLISNTVKQELIDNPIKGKKYKLEAMMILQLLEKGILQIKANPETEAKTNKLLYLANNIFKTKNKFINIVSKAETEVLVLSLFNSKTSVIDERTTRMLIENPKKLAELLEKKLHSKVTIDTKNLNEFKKETSEMKIIRSTELMIIAFELGLFKDYLKKTTKKEFLDGLLWGLKLRGCSISIEEIKEIIKLEVS